MSFDTKLITCVVALAALILLFPVASTPDAAACTNEPNTWHAHMDCMNVGGEWWCCEINAYRDCYIMKIPTAYGCAYRTHQSQ